MRVKPGVKLVNFDRPQGTVNVRERIRAGTDWYRIVNLDGGTAEIYIYDEIGYWGTSAADFIGKLQATNASRIELHINSPGGEVFDGIAIYNALRQHPATVTSYVDGLAASAASFIAMAGDTVVCARNAQMMIHDAMGICVGNAAEMQRMADLLVRLSDNIADIYAQKAGGSIEDWRALMLAETWFSATEAVAYGLADEMTGADESADGESGEGEGDDGTGDSGDGAPADRWDLSLFSYAGRTAAPPPAPIDRSEPVPALAPECGEWLDGFFTQQAADNPFAALWEGSNT